MYKLTRPWNIIMARGLTDDNGSIKQTINSFKGDLLYTLIETTLYKIAAKTVSREYFQKLQSGLICVPHGNYLISQLFIPEK